MHLKLLIFIPKFLLLNLFLCISFYYEMRLILSELHERVMYSLILGFLVMVDSIGIIPIPSCRWTTPASLRPPLVISDAPGVIMMPVSFLVSHALLLVFYQINLLLQLIDFIFMIWLQLANFALLLILNRIDYGFDLVLLFILLNSISLRGLCNHRRLSSLLSILMYLIMMLYLTGLLRR